jgi:hypothetical protein
MNTHPNPPTVEVEFVPAFSWVAFPATADVDASDLGLAAGVWPLSLSHNGRRWDRTTCRRQEDGDLVFVNYEASDWFNGAAKIKVWND